MKNIRLICVTFNRTRPRIELRCVFKCAIPGLPMVLLKYDMRKTGKVS